MKRYRILENDVTLECCNDLINKEFYGEYDGEKYIVIYPNTEWLLKEGYKDDNILLLPCEVEEIQ